MSGVVSVHEHVNDIDKRRSLWGQIRIFLFHVRSYPRKTKLINSFCLCMHFAHSWHKYFYHWTYFAMTVISFSLCFVIFKVFFRVAVQFLIFNLSCQKTLMIRIKVIIQKILIIFNASCKISNDITHSYFFHLSIIKSTTAYFYCHHPVKVDE